MNLADGLPAEGRHVIFIFGLTKSRDEIALTMRDEMAA
jgi:hypothetical protein